MYELSQIILLILWTLRPAMAVETNLIDIIRSGFALFGDDETLEAMANDPDHCAIVASALCAAHTKLDLMIYLRACEIAGCRSRSRGFEPDYTYTGSRHTPETCWRSFRRLVHRFEDRERLAHLRATRLKREAACPLRLAPSAQSSTLRVDPASLRPVEATHRSLFNVQIASLSPKDWGRWIGAFPRRDGGGSHARAPPSHPDCRLPTAHCPLPRKPRFRERLRAPTPPHGLPAPILVYRPITTDHPQKGQKTRMTGKIVTVFGGSGFLGRHVVRALCRQGWRVRVASRRPHLSGDVKLAGDVGQVQLVQANVRNRLSIKRAFENAEAVVNLVGVVVSIGFLECDSDILSRRFTETRRPHPLADDLPVTAAIETERRLLAPLHDQADLVVDTSRLPPGELKRILAGQYAGSAKRALKVFLTSFGFRNGLPRDADLVFDVRFLKNPHYEPDLRPQTGLDAPVGAYIEQDPALAPFIDHLIQLHPHKVLLLHRRRLKHLRHELDVAVHPDVVLHLVAAVGGLGCSEGGEAGHSDVLLGTHLRASGYRPQLDHHLERESSHLKRLKTLGLPKLSTASKLSPSAAPI